MNDFFLHDIAQLRLQDLHAQAAQDRLTRTLMPVLTRRPLTLWLPRLTWQPRPVPSPQPLGCPAGQPC